MYSNLDHVFFFDRYRDSGLQTEVTDQPLPLYRSKSTSFFIYIQKLNIMSKTFLANICNIIYKFFLIGIGHRLIRLSHRSAKAMAHFFIYPFAANVDHNEICIVGIVAAACFLTLLVYQSEPYQLVYDS